MGTDHEPTAAEALQAWRDAEREAIRSTAQREATEEAIGAAELAEAAARATATAAAAALAAAQEPSRAASAVAEAATKVLRTTRAQGDARRAVEQEALAAGRPATFAVVPQLSLQEPQVLARRRGPRRLGGRTLPSPPARRRTGRGGCPRMARSSATRSVPIDGLDAVSRMIAIVGQRLGVLE